MFSLTPDGKVLFDYAKEMLQLHQSLIEHLKETSVKGEARFGLPDYLPRLKNIHVSMIKHDHSSHAINVFETFVLKKLRV